MNLKVINTGDEDLNLPFQHLLSEEQLEQVRKHSNTVRFKNKDVIFRQNTRTSHIMLVESGLVKVFKEGRQEKNMILKLAVTGEYLGLMSVFGKDTHEYSASTIHHANIRFIDINIFKNLILENGKYALKLIHMISLDGLFIFDRLMGQSYKQLPGRIADVLLYFSGIIFKKDEFDIPLSRRELAELAGTTKESFIRTLTEFKNDRIIELEGTKIRIRSKDIVETLSKLG